MPHWRRTWQQHFVVWVERKVRTFLPQKEFLTPDEDYSQILRERADPLPARYVAVPRVDVKISCPRDISQSRDAEAFHSLSLGPNFASNAAPARSSAQRAVPRDRVGWAPLAHADLHVPDCHCAVRVVVRGEFKRARRAELGPQI